LKRKKKKKYAKVIIGEKGRSMGGQGLKGGTRMGAGKESLE